MKKTLQVIKVVLETVKTNIFNNIYIQYSSFFVDTPPYVPIKMFHQDYTNEHHRIIQEGR